MTSPLFFINEYDPASPLIALNEETSKHIIQVLRMKQGEQIKLTDGRGHLFNCSITEEHKKKCMVRVQAKNFREPKKRKVQIAISLVKNTSRFEWFLEKATEIGVGEIIPLICERTERQHFRYDRMKGVLISAMLQSQQCWLPVLQEPVKFENFKTDAGFNGHKLIAHCEEATKKLIVDFSISDDTDCLICIGPEGDFTGREIDFALSKEFIPVSLGATRLRTETAGIVAATMLCINRA